MSNTTKPGAALREKERPRVRCMLAGILAGNVPRDRKTPFGFWQVSNEIGIEILSAALGRKAPTSFPLYGAQTLEVLNGLMDEAMAAGVKLDPQTGGSTRPTPPVIVSPTRPALASTAKASTGAQAWTDARLRALCTAVFPNSEDWTRDRQIRGLYFANLEIPGLESELGAVSKRFGPAPALVGIRRAIHADQQAKVNAFLAKH